MRFFFFFLPYSGFVLEDRLVLQLMKIGVMVWRWAQRDRQAACPGSLRHQTPPAHSGSKTLMIVVPVPP